MPSLSNVCCDSSFVVNAYYIHLLSYIHDSRDKRLVLEPRKMAGDANVLGDLLCVCVILAETASFMNVMGARLF